MNYDYDGRPNILKARWGNRLAELGLAILIVGVPLSIISPNIGDILPYNRDSRAEEDRRDIKDNYS